MGPCRNGLRINSRLRQQERLGRLSTVIGEDVLILLRREEGTLIVASTPMPEEELRALPGLHLGEEDGAKAKRARQSERILRAGARVTGRVNVVEMSCPEGGTYRFNDVVDPTETVSKRLAAERTRVGSFGRSDVRLRPSRSAVAHRIVNAPDDAIEPITRGTPLRDVDIPDAELLFRPPQEAAAVEAAGQRGGDDGDRTLTITVKHAGRNLAFWAADTDAGHGILGGLLSNEAAWDTGSGSDLGGWGPFNGIAPCFGVTNRLVATMGLGAGKARMRFDTWGDGLSSAESFLIEGGGDVLAGRCATRVTETGNP